MTQQPEILFEDNHLLVLNKPPLLATMGAAAGEPSLLADAKEYLRKKYNKPGNVYLGVVSRLDSFTSGIVVFARNSKSAGRLSSQFRDGTPEKTYWAQLPNRLPAASGSLENWVYKDDRLKRMFAIESPTDNPPPGAKLARLNYSTLAQTNGGDPELVLVEVQLETGRKHQIRVQFEHLGCPIVGDRKYGSQIPFKKGIALHSKSLKIIHPTQKTQLSFDVPPPKWWNSARFGIR